MKISEPIEIKNVAFKNRVVMAPMVRFGFPSENGIMGEKLMRDYLGRADKGAGLIICQALNVSEDRRIEERAGAYSDRHIDYLKKIAEAYHKNDTRFFAQLALYGFSFYNKSSGNVNELTKEELTRDQGCFHPGR